MEKDLILSCRKGDLERVKYLVEQRDAEVNHRDRYDSTPLYYACLCGHIDLVKYLLQQGARCDANTFDGERCIYGALTTDIRNVLRRHKIVSAQTVRRELFTEFLRRLLERGEYSDVTFLVHGQEFLAHRCVLIARSAFFKERFLRGGKWANRSEIAVNKAQVNPDAFRAIMCYLYTGQLTIQLAQVGDVLRLARYCQLHALQRRLTEMADRAQCFQNSKPGTHVTTICVERAPGDAALADDFGVLADQALPVEFRHWVPVFELPHLLDEETNEPGPARAPPFHDIVFSVAGSSYLCHQAFFCGRSEFFRALVSDPLGEHRESVSSDEEGACDVAVVPLRHFSPQIFIYILYYVYQDHVELDASTVYDVLVAADMCLLSGLKRQCGNFIAQRLDPNTVFCALRAARLFMLPRLEDACYYYLAENIESLMANSELHAFIVEDATSVSCREDVDSIDIVDQIRFHLTADTMDDAQERLALIDHLLDQLGYDA